MSKKVRAVLRDRLTTISLVLGALLAWEGASRLGLVDPLLFPAPSVVLRGLLDLVLHENLANDLGATLHRVLLGWLLGCLPAWALGLAMGWSTRLRRILDPVLAAMHPMPKIALLPLLMVVFGLGEASKVAVVAVATFFPMLINTMAGVQQMDAQLFDVVRSYGASPRQVLAKVVLPGSLPMTFVGLRIALNVALLITIAVELVNAPDGLGAVIWLAWQTMRTEYVYAGLLVIGALGLVMTAVVDRVCRWSTPWNQTSNGG